MCGRFTHRYTWSQLHTLLNLTSPPLELTPRHNLAPTQLAPVVRLETAHAPGHTPGLAAAFLRWGLIPSWATDPSIGNSLINARAETVATKPAFRSAFRHRRAVVPVSGFYEWHAAKAKSPKQPFYITPSPTNPPILCLAALWERWHPADHQPLETFTLITTDANPWMRPLHDRMPAILNHHDLHAWLNPDSPPDLVSALLRPAPDDVLQRWPVSTKVNSPRSDDESMIQPLANPIDKDNLFC